MLTSILNVILFVTVLVLFYRLITIQAEYLGELSNYKLWIKEQDKTIEKLYKQLEKQANLFKDVEV